MSSCAAGGSVDDPQAIKPAYIVIAGLGGGILLLIAIAVVLLCCYRLRDSDERPIVNGRKTSKTTVSEERVVEEGGGGSGGGGGEVRQKKETKVKAAKVKKEKKPKEPKQKKAKAAPKSSSKKDKRKSSHDGEVNHAYMAGDIGGDGVVEMTEKTTLGDADESHLVESNPYYDNDENNDHDTYRSVSMGQVSSDQLQQLSSCPRVLTTDGNENQFANI